MNKTSTTLQVRSEGGLLSERIQLWRENRLWYIYDSGYLIDGFETRPGTHPWQGEHLGKWLHAATLSWKVTADPKVKEEMDKVVQRLISSQDDNGYMGTYEKDITFYELPENSEDGNLSDDVNPLMEKNSKKGGWDIWTHRYNLFGLLTYEKEFPNEAIVEACVNIGELLYKTYYKTDFQT